MATVQPPTANDAAYIRIDRQASAAFASVKGDISRLQDSLSSHDVVSAKDDLNNLIRKFGQVLAQMDKNPPTPKFTATDALTRVTITEERDAFIREIADLNNNVDIQGDQVLIKKFQATEGDLHREARLISQVPGSHP